MKKKKENIKKNDDVQLESWIQVIKRNCDTVPGFKPLLKLIIWIIFILILVILIALTSGKKGGSGSTTKTTTTQAVKYQDILTELLDNKEYVCNIKINDNTYILTGSFGNNILVGTFETSEGTYKYKVKENTIYEIRVGNEIVNNDLFKDVTKDFIVNNSLVNILKNNSGIKLEDNSYLYNDIVLNGIKYVIKVYVDNNLVKAIDITGDNIVYNFSYTI